MRSSPVVFDPAPELPAQGSGLAIPWRRIWVLVRPVRFGLAGMMGLTVVGSLVGLVPPLALGALVNGLAARHQWGLVAGWAGLIAAAVVVGAAAFAVSDGLYAHATGRLYRDLRVLMFEGVLRRPPTEAEAASGLASRFVSDAETLEQLTVAALDVGTLGLVELVAALVALGVLDPWAVCACTGLILVTAVVARRAQAPIASAGQARQEALEGMSRTLAGAVAGRADPRGSRERFRLAAGRVLGSEVRLGWLQAANHHGSGALTGLGPIAVAVIAAFQGGFRAGTLLSLYLLAERAFAGADSLLDLSLDVELVRGAVGRCFELIDAVASGDSGSHAAADPPPRQRAVGAGASTGL